MKNNLLTVLPWLLLVAGVVFLATFIQNQSKGIDYKELIKAKDETIQAVARERDAERQMKDVLINELQEKDSLLQLRIKTTVTKYERIPVIVSQLSDDELRSAVESFR